MKTNEGFQPDGQDAIQWQPVISRTGIGFASKAGNQLRRIIYIASFAGMGLFFFGCSTGYVATQPSYVEYSRPAQPSSHHIWIDGDYKYKHQTHSYKQNNGHWHKKSQGRTYVPGHWQSEPRGQYWVAGYWQSQDR